MWRRLKAALGFLGMCIPTVVSAQSRTPAARCVFDTAAHRDTIVTTVSIFVRKDADSVADPALTRAIGMMMRGRFHPPESIASLFYPNTAGPKEGPFGPGGWTFGTFELTIRPNGGFDGIRWLVSTGDSATDDAFLRAVREAGDSGIGTALRPLLRGSDVRVRVVVTSRVDDSVAVILRVRVPVIRAQSSVRIRTFVAPGYPETAKVAGVQARVELQFIVDESGHVPPNSIQVVSAAYQEFVESAVNAVRAETFRPAMAGGCPLKMQVEQGVRFTIGKP